MTKPKFEVTIQMNDKPIEDEDRKIMVVYQDCFLCGSRKKKIPPKIKKLTDLGYEVLLVGFTNPLAQPFIAKAIELGVRQMPFYTDGKHFTSTIDKMIELVEPKKNRKNKKTKDLKDGAIPEN